MGTGPTETVRGGRHAERGAEFSARTSAAQQVVIRTEVLGCGARLVTERMAEARSATIGVWVGTGARDERPERAGASHFLEHLLFKGTPSWTAAAIAESVDEVGGDMNAFTTKEYTAFYLRLLAEDLPLGLDVLSAIMTDPALRPDEIEAERQVILDEILMHADEPADFAMEQCSAALFPEHPLGRDVLGTQASVEALSAERDPGFLRRALPDRQPRDRSGRRREPLESRRRDRREIRLPARRCRARTIRSRAPRDPRRSESPPDRAGSSRGRGAHMRSSR